MLVVTAYHEGDRREMKRLADWLAELNGTKNHEMLLVPAYGSHTEGLREPLTKAFKTVHVVPMWEPLHGWPRAANVTWANIAQRIQDPHPKATPAPQPWIWLEPDAIPLCADWLDQLEQEYAKAQQNGRVFMGAEVDHTADGGRRYMSGVGIYPMNTPIACGEKILDFNHPEMKEAFDPYLLDIFLPLAHLTPLIHHVWVTSRDPDVLPTFPDEASLSTLRSGAVLFHRNKDGTLIERLRERRNKEIAAPASASEKSEDAGFSVPGSLTLGQQIFEEQQRRIAELEKKLETVLPATNKHGRTAEQQAKIDARMAKARAARKKNKLAAK